MVERQKEINFLIKRQEPETIGNLPIVEIVNIIERIPRGEWRIPSPNHDLAIKRTDRKIARKYKKEIFGLRCDKVLGKMITFCDSAQKGFNAEEILNEKHQVQQNYQNLVNLKMFRNIMHGKIDVNNNLGDLINSCRKGFARLVGKDARKRIGIKMLPRIDNEDIENTRFLVKGLRERLIVKD